MSDNPTKLNVDQIFDVLDEACDEIRDKESYLTTADKLRIASRMADICLFGTPPRSGT